MGEKIFVTGATGNVGSLLVEKLREKGADFIAGISPRHTVEEFAKKGMDAVVYDLKDPASLTSAFRDIDRLFFLVPFTPYMESNAADMLGAAREAGMKHILRMSALGADPDSEYALLKIQGTMDRAIIDSGISYTIIRPNNFMQNYIIYYGSFIRKEGTLYLPQADGKSSYVHVADIADVAAEILCNPEPHISKIYDITGDKALTNQDIVDIISSATGKDVNYLSVTDDMAELAMLQMNVPEWIIDKMLSLHRFIREGHAASVSSAVSEITGHNPISFETFAADSAGAWK